MIISAERVKFKRPNSDKEELGLMVGEFEKHIIIDSSLNILINYSLEEHLLYDRADFNLTEL